MQANAQVAKSVDARDLKSLGFSRAGSSPALGTISNEKAAIAWHMVPMRDGARALDPPDCLPDFVSRWRRGHATPRQLSPVPEEAMGVAMASPWPPTFRPASLCYHREHHADRSRGVFMSAPYPLSLAQKNMFLAVLSAIFLAAMDQTVVATALPTIAEDLHGLAHLPWVITAYLLSSTVSLPIYGKLGDLMERKVVLTFAVAFFLVGSILSGLAWSLESLVLFRALQGLGGGGILVTAIASIADFLPLEQRGKYQGLVGAAFGLATLIGPFLGGFVVQHFGWRWIFYINIPFGIFCLIIVQWAFPKTQRKRFPFDIVGAGSLFFGLSALVLLMELGTLDSWIWVLLALISASIWGIFSGVRTILNPYCLWYFFVTKSSVPV